MKIVLIGASGFIGSAILEEALSRRHRVKSLVSTPAKLPWKVNQTIVKTNVHDTGELAEQIYGFDAVISAFSGRTQTDAYDYYVSGVKSIIHATKMVNKVSKNEKIGTRLLIVGDAGSLEVTPGLPVVDTELFPQKWRSSAQGVRDALDLLKQERDLKWTMLSPPTKIEPGVRTSKFRLGKDQLLVDSAGKSYISLQDYAVAMINELEHPKHTKERFCVAY